MSYLLQPSNKVSVGLFIAGIKQHRDAWAVVTMMNVVDLAEASVFLSR